MTELALTRSLYRALIVSFVVAGAVVLIWHIPATIIDILFGIILATGLLPIIRIATGWRVRGIRPPPAMIVLLVYVVAGTVLVAGGAALVSLLIADLEDLSTRVPDYGAGIAAWLRGTVEGTPLIGQLTLPQWTPDLAHSLANVVGNVAAVAGGIAAFFGQAINLTFVLVIALYLSVDGAAILQYVVDFVPADRQAQVDRLAGAIVWRLGHWVQAQLTLCLIIGVGAALGLRFLGVPYAGLLGLLWGLAELMPGIGPLVATLPSVALAFSVSPLTGVLAVVFCVSWSQLESNTITPQLMGRAVALHPLIVLLALMVGSELLGIVGALLAVPIAASVAVVVSELHEERLLSIADHEDEQPTAQATMEQPRPRAA